MAEAYDIVDFYRQWVETPAEEFPDTPGEIKEKTKEGSPLFVRYRTIYRGLFEVAGESKDTLAQIGASLTMMGLSMLQASQREGVSMDVLKEEITSLDPADFDATPLSEFNILFEEGTGEDDDEDPYDLFGD